MAESKGRKKKHTETTLVPVQVRVRRNEQWAMRRDARIMLASSVGFPIMFYEVLE